MTTRRTRPSAATGSASQDATTAETNQMTVPSSPSASVSPISPWLAPLLCLRSSSFGVAGSVAAKIGLTDDWTEGVVQRIQQAAGAAMHVVGSNSSSSREEEADPASIAVAAWRHTLLFYFVRVSFVLLKLYLDGRMLQLFVAAMHASNSLLASTYNQCCAVVLAGVCGFLLFSEPLSPLWLLGASLILAGVACVQWGNSDAETEEIDDAKDHASSSSSKGKLD